MVRAGSARPLVVGRYALFDAIASGGMASVCFGRLLDGPGGFGRTVAIKRMHPHVAKEPQFVAMFVDEARLTARIHHPNVVASLDVVVDAGELFVVMEYVEGESLARLQAAAARAGERLAPDVVSSVLVGALHGLHAAHEATSARGEHLGLVHRDVSGHNVLVGVDGVARVADFGVAKAVGRLQTTKEGQVKGKLAYMAPEQLDGRPVTRRTDVYAAGVVLWEALVGEPLFDAESEGAVINKILSAPVPPPSARAPGLPAALDAVVLRAVERDAELRFATAREMALALQAALAPASARAVGEQVERLAAPALAERREILAEIERSVASPARATRGDAREPARPAVSAVARRAPWIAAVGVALVTCGALSALAARGPHARAPLPAPSATGEARAADPPNALAAEPGAAEPGASVSTGVPPAADAPSAARAPSAAPARPAAPRVHRAPRAAPTAPRCEPPWYVDSAGVKRWKADCR